MTPEGGCRRLRLLVTTSTFPVQLDDGTPRFVHDLAQALADHAEVIVLGPDAPGASRSEQIGRLEIRRTTYFFPRSLQRLALGRGMPENLRSSWLARLQVPFYLIGQWRATRAIVRDSDIDVVNPHWLVPQGLAAALARGRERSFGLLLHVHSTDVHLLRRVPFGRRIARYVVRRCDAVFAASSYVRDALDDLLGFASGASVRSMGVHAGAFARESGQDSAPRTEAGEVAEDVNGFLLFVGRLMPVKGVDVLLEAMPRILHRHPELGLSVVGRGPEESRLRALAEGLGIGGRVRWLGRKSHLEIVQLLHGCRAAIVPSIVTPRGETEGMPTVVLEAMAAGSRVVASTVGGIPDVVRHGDNGWLCRPQDPRDLAEKVLSALEAPQAAEVVQSALETARQYDWREVARSYMDCLSTLTED